MKRLWSISELGLICCGCMKKKPTAAVTLWIDQASGNIDRSKYWSFRYLYMTGKERCISFMYLPFSFCVSTSLFPPSYLQFCWLLCIINISCVMWLFWIVWACVCALVSLCVCGITHTSASAKECVLLCLCVCVPVPQYQILLSQLSASLSLVVICLSVCCSTFNLFFSFTLLLSCECIICSPALSLSVRCTFSCPLPWLCILLSLCFIPSHFAVFTFSIFFGSFSGGGKRKEMTKQKITKINW